MGDKTKCVLSLDKKNNQNKRLDDMYAILGLIVSSVLVIIARVSYLFFFDKSCEIQLCLLQLSETQKVMYIGVILIGSYNAHLISKGKKNSILIFEFIGTFIFAFALNFLNLG